MRAADEIRADILRLVSEYYQSAHATRPFVPGVSRVPYAGRVFDEREIQLGVESVLRFGLTAGPFAKEFESRLQSYFSSQGALLVNSGSSANLLMIATLCSEQVKGRLVPGDEVITPAVTFPTTLNPILQFGLTPVFLDCRPGEYSMDVSRLEEALSEKTRCVFVPHTVGIPPNMDAIVEFCKRHDLWLLEDGCDALGSRWNGKLAGTFGEMSSISFYPAHHITMGEGGMVVVNKAALRRTSLSIRDWGRDCWCDPGVSNSCGMRFGWQLGELPFGYDHKYTYSNIGFNLKVSEMQAAVGCAQLDKLESFIRARKQNAEYYCRAFKRFEEHLVLPKTDPEADPSWFCFPITLKPHVNRRSFIEWLEGRNIETRLVFAGNILKQPAFINIRRRIVGNLDETDKIMNQTFFIGVYPGLTAEMREYVVDAVADYFQSAI